MTEIRVPTSVRFINLTGQTFGRLTVVSYAGLIRRRSAWKCKCSCGKEKTAVATCLMQGLTRSCGCLKAESNRKNATTHGHSQDGRASEYASWHAMKQRCTDRNDTKYDRYGGAGITVCERWLKSFECFLEDMGKKPSSEHTIDRFPNREGNYEPGNCRWASPKEQARNKKSNRFIEIDGQTKTIKEWSEVSGVHHCTIWGRLERGWDAKDAVFRKPNKPRTGITSHV